MKILIASDSHGRSDLLYKAFDTEKPDMVIHLGDLEDNKDIVERELGAPRIPCLFIKGNCDYDSEGKLLRSSVFTLKNHRFFCTHGHLYSVNYNLNGLMYEAKDNDCDIVLFGHIHRPVNEFMDLPFGAGKIHVINPGSIAYPRGGFVKSYMIMNLKDDGAYDIDLKTL